MGYVFRNEDARRYEEWFLSEPGRSALAIEKELLYRVWSPSKLPQRVLEVGCGTGIFLEWFSQLKHQVTGLDPSEAMLDVAANRLPGRITLDRGYAEHLPYADNAFDTVALITSLEFVDDPLQALAEALRVAKRHVLIGSLNRYSLLAWQRRLERLWKPTIFKHARFFSVFDLQRLSHEALSGALPLRWRTCLALPLNSLKYLYFLENSRYFQWHPFGHFIAMRIDLCYPLQTLQEPLLCDLPTGMGATRMHASCWRSHDSKKGYNPDNRMRARPNARNSREISLFL